MMDKNFVAINLAIDGEGKESHQERSELLAKEATAVVAKASDGRYCCAPLSGYCLSGIKRV